MSTGNSPKIKTAKCPCTAHWLDHPYKELEIRNLSMDPVKPDCGCKLGTFGLARSFDIIHGGVDPSHILLNSRQWLNDSYHLKIRRHHPQILNFVPHCSQSSGSSGGGDENEQRRRTEGRRDVERIGRDYGKGSGERRKSAVGREGVGGG
ncbi:hypothetical protein K0M31_018292 [Melipona bicolor]|uniref:Uncharacterized protein n=1 Tax=Melipona bicolor TaxID=60889 RepID=A0AA40KDZ8_9HYME|nr:hypothetical protein K0M31_018292 [Melipona bicolor]